MVGFNLHVSNLLDNNSSIMGNIYMTKCTIQSVSEKQMSEKINEGR